MANFPALPLFTDAIIADTQHLSHEEFGIYLRLLMYAWRDKDCSLPADRKKLGRFVHISHTSKKKFEIVEDLLSQFFYEKNDKFFQKRLLKEKQFLEKNKQNNSLNGELGAVIKSLKILGYELSPPELTLKQKDKPRLLEKLRGRLREMQAPTPTPIPLAKAKVARAREAETSNTHRAATTEPPTSASADDVGFQQLGAELIDEHSICYRASSEPLQKWWRAGIDPDLIRRTVEDLATKAAVAGKTIDSWKYFHSAVMEAHGIAKASPSAAGSQSKPPRYTLEELREASGSIFSDEDLLDAANKYTLEELANLRRTMWKNAIEHFDTYRRWPDNVAGKTDDCPPDLWQRFQESRG